MSRAERAKTTDLERIRDNQRRSRQRRKEHLQDVEEKLRLCQLQGVEASIEVQVEARKVIDENKKLRTLLRKHGIPDKDIADYLVSGTALPPGHLLPDHLTPPPIGGNVQTLEHLLEPRPARCLELSLQSSAPSPAIVTSIMEDSAASWIVTWACELERSSWYPGGWRLRIDGRRKLLDGLGPF